MLNQHEAMFARQLADRVRTLRMRHALSQDELASRAGLARQVVINIENGHRLVRPSSVRKLARALGVQPLQLTT
jgi:transcriptional regulator with XRE-family HTH domain